MIQDIISQLLINRGIKTKQDRELFFTPKLKDFESDCDIKNIDIAKKRIQKAIKNEELIFVSGDYDVDGVCGAAVLYLGLTSAGAKVLPYIPHREKEGYGISKIGLDLAKEKGAKLVISVDCGIVDFEEAKYADSLGLDLIITDHHQPLNKKPKSFTIVHSTKMCGTAVAWCLVKSLSSKETADELLDLVAIATVADMMPMLGVNRAFVQEGLEKLNKTKRVGLLALIEESGLEVGELGAYEIGHMLAPRLNAAGRLDSAMDALRLVCTKNAIKAKELAKSLENSNNDRKKLTIDAVDSARLMIKKTKKIHILYHEDWNPGIIGLVAGRICEETKRPAIAIAKGELESKGSARSIKGINIVEVIRQCSDILQAVGGHPGAAGFTIKTDQIKIFQQRVESIIEEIFIEEVGNGAEMELLPEDITMGLAKELVKFEPFGIGNKNPVFATTGVKLSNLKTVGIGKHLKGRANNIDFIAFNKGEKATSLKEGQSVDLVYNLEINKFNGSEKLQLVVKEIGQ